MMGIIMQHSDGLERKGGRQVLKSLKKMKECSM